MLVVKFRRCLSLQNFIHVLNFSLQILTQVSRMKFRKKGSLSFKLSRNISRVKSLKSVLNINIEGTRARRKFKREGTPASKARGHAKNLGTRARGHESTPTWKARGHAENLGTRARQHRRHEGTPKIWARGHEGTPTSKARGHVGHAI